MNFPLSFWERASARAVAGSHSHNLTHNLRTRLTVLRKNKPSNQQKTTKKRRVNHEHPIPRVRAKTAKQSKSSIKLSRNNLSVSAALLEAVNFYTSISIFY